MKLDLRCDIQQPITTAGRRQPSAEAFICSSAAVRNVYISEEFSVVTFYPLTMATLAWTISFRCKMYLGTLASSALYRVTRPKSAEKHTNTVGHSTLHTPLQGLLLIGFTQASREKERGIVLRLPVRG
jgi:hypothetical protein